MAADAEPAGASVIATPVETTPPQIAAEAAIASESQAADPQAAEPRPALPEAALPTARLPDLQAVEPAAAVAAEPTAAAVTPAVALGDAAAKPGEPELPAVDPSLPNVTAEDIIKAAQEGGREPMPARPATEPAGAAAPSDTVDETVDVDEPAPPADASTAKKPANLFEEFDADVDAPAADANLFDEEPAGSVPAAAEPADESSDKPAGEEEPAAAEPDPFDDAHRGPAEPLRRWVDASGEHATVGTLVDVRDDAVEILKANGRTVMVPLGRLSVTDRAYAAAVGARLAAGKPAVPGPIATAGL